MQKYEVMYHNSIAKNVRKYRKQAHFSQEKLAEKLGCSREFISRVENRKEKISLSMLFRLAETFSAKPENFLY